MTAKYEYVLYEPTIFVRATNESRNMSAATKKRGDKRAPRNNSVRQINTVTKQAFKNFLGPYRYIMRLDIGPVYRSEIKLIVIK
jgi:hypothetical protein